MRRAIDLIIHEITLEADAMFSKSVLLVLQSEPFTAFAEELDLSDRQRLEVAREVVRRTAAQEDPGPYLNDYARMFRKPIKAAP